MHSSQLPSWQFSHSSMPFNFTPARRLVHNHLPCSASIAATEKPAKLVCANRADGCRTLPRNIRRAKSSRPDLHKPPRPRKQNRPSSRPARWKRSTCLRRACWLGKNSFMMATRSRGVIARCLPRTKHPFSATRSSASRSTGTDIDREGILPAFAHSAANCLAGDVAIASIFRRNTGAADLPRANDFR